MRESEIFHGDCEKRREPSDPKMSKANFSVWKMQTEVEILLTFQMIIQININIYRELREYKAKLWNNYNTGRKKQNTEMNKKKMESGKAIGSLKCLDKS